LGGIIGIQIVLDFNEPIEWVNTISLDMKCEPLECNVRTWKAYPNDKNGEGYHLNDKIKQACNFVYIPASRNIASELKISQWSMLGKMMKMIFEGYIRHYDSDESKLKDKFKEIIKPAKEFLEKNFADNEVTFSKFSQVFKENCRKNSIGLNNKIEPQLNIYNLNWFYKTLQIHVKEDTCEKFFESEEVGSGMQNLLILSIFQTYAEIVGKDVLFGIEEPEIYLYPQAQRALYKSIIKLSESSQIFYSTHSQNFVNASRADDIILIRKNSQGETFKLEKKPYFTSENAVTKHKYKIYTQFNPSRNELFFAQKVLFVEGDSDRILFSTLCEKIWDVDIDREGIAIIECGGKGGVNYFIGVCYLIGFQDYFAVWDEDPLSEDYSPEKDFLPETLQKGKGLEIKGNLEKLLNLPDSDKNKVENAHKWVLAVTLEKIPMEFDCISNFLKTKQGKGYD
jgi:predicted ATP-dependent endonuclease of OLD family